MALPTYERIRVDGQTMILRNPTETTILGTPVLTGTVVDLHGEEVAPRGVDSTIQIIQLDLITKRTSLVMNHHYAMLERA